MINKLRARRAAWLAAQGLEAGESGFTLIELMVVVLIIAILMAIAIPTFLGAKNSAQERGAQENVANMLTDLASLNANSSDYNVAPADPNGLTSTQVTGVDTAFSITDGGALPTWGPNVVYVEQSGTASASTSWMFIMSQATDGSYWCAVEFENYPTAYGVSAKGQTPVVPAAGTSPTPPAANGDPATLAGLGANSTAFPGQPASGAATNNC